MASFDVVVVGNGSMGSTLANQLKKKDSGLRVALVGPRSREGSATLAAGAMLNAFAEIPYGVFENETLSLRHQLSTEALKGWDVYGEELAEFNPDLKVRLNKTIMILNSNSTKSEIRTFNYVHKYLQENGIDHEDLDIESIDFLAPIPKYPVFRALRLPDGHVDSRQVMKALDQQGVALGVETIDQSVVELTRSDFSPMSSEKTTHITLESGETIEALHVVIANGAFAQKLIDKIPELSERVPRLIFGAGFGMDLRLHPNFRNRASQNTDLARNLSNLDCVIRTPDRGGSCGVHLVPYGDGRFYLGASFLPNIEPHQGSVIDSKSMILNTAFCEFHRNFCDFTEEQRAVGFRPMTADGFPLIGESDIKGIWFLNGMNRDGFTCAPLLAKQLVDQICEKAERSSYFEVFQPCRPLLSYKNREQAVEDNLASLLAIEHHHGGGVQAPLFVNEYLEVKREQVNKLYDKRGFENFGIFSPLWPLYSNDDIYPSLEHRRQWN